MAKKSSKGNNLKEKKVPHIVEHVSDSSDEEIDEDEAFNSDDERKYGALFSAANKSNKKKAQMDSKTSSDADDDASYSVSEGDESDDDNDDNDDDDDDSSTGLAGSDDDASDGDGGQYMLDLLNNMDKKSPKEEEQKKAREDALAMTQHSSLIQESEFSAAAVQSSQLTLDQLMNGITDTKGFGVVQKTMSQMVVSNNKTNILDDDNKAISVTKAPVSRVVSERASRKVHYEEQKDEVSRWTDVVKQNREAETLDFRSNNQKNSRVTRDTLVGKFEPTTDFEKELAQMLEKAGDEKQMMEQEQNALIAGATKLNDGEDNDEDDLGSGKISMEEYKKRMGELSKMRALLFYEEQKRHHINKIKSKKYRKIRKKKRDKEKEADFDDDDPDAVRELEEKEEMERMKERMTLAHKNTSKWAKRVLRRGGKIDMDTRKALSAQIRIGDDLRKKMMGENSDDDEEYNNMDPIDQARALLLETEKDETDSNKKTKKSSLLEMSFMQKGIESQRQRAKEEARELLAELEANQEEDDHNDSDSSSEDVPTKKGRKKVASNKETEKIITEGSLVAKGLQFGNSTSITVSGSIDLDANDNNKNGSMKVSSSTDDTIVGELKSTKNKKKNTPGLLPKGETKVTKTTSSQLAVNHKTSSSSRNNTNTSTSNPWLVQDDDDDEEQTIPTTSNKKNNTSNSSSSKKKKKTTIVDISGAANIIVSNSDDSLSEENKTILNNDAADSKHTDVDSNSKLVTLSQEELVRRAFAAPSEKELDEEFEKEKVCLQ